MQILSERNRRRRRRRPFAGAAAALAFFCLQNVCHNQVLVTALDDDNNRKDNSSRRENIKSDHGGNVSDPETEPWLDYDQAEVDRDNNIISPPLLAKKKASQEEENEAEPHRSMKEELQLRAKDQLNSQDRMDKETSMNLKERKEYQQFMDWCHQVLGIQTNLEIHTFYYYDYMTALMMHPSSENSEETDGNDDDDDDNLPTPKTDDNAVDDWQDPPLIPVRGLRATRNITQGEVIISIPFQALLTVSTTIDQDPVLSRVMGKEARQKHGWVPEQDESGNLESVDFFELPLLAMALLHHYKLGTSSPLYPYIHMLRKSPLDSMPFLWSKEKRHQQYYSSHHHRESVNKGIQTVARSLRLELKEMYNTVADTLVKEHPDLFGRADPQKQQYDTLDDEDWAFSFENFQWAFAMVNSRHWLLPIDDLETASQKYPPSATPMKMQSQGTVDGVPPAEMPTDAWVEQQEEEDEEDNIGEEELEGRLQQQQYARKTVEPKTPSFHSFLAPVADLLNFGPPCTRGHYNAETHTFDIIASCDYTQGQEVTFWYSDECDEVVIGNYGFTHPMVPKCPSKTDYKLSEEKWKQKALGLEEALGDAYEDMDIIDSELQHVQQILVNCDCCDAAREVSDAAREQQEPSQGNANGLHGNYLRNQHDAAPSHFRGGGGTMLSRSSSGRRSGSHGDGGKRSSRGGRHTASHGSQRSRNTRRGSAGIESRDLDPDL